VSHRSDALVGLPSGALMRRTGPEGGPAVICVNGGVRRAVRGNWSASVAWLVRRLAPAQPPVGFYEVRYRIRSWTRLEMCVEDARAALAVVAGSGAGPVALLGYSMGGAVAIAAAGDPAVATVIGLAPWIPDDLGVETLAGRRVAVIHGSIDGAPFGVRPGESRRGVERMRAAGVEASYTLIRGALHAIALPGPGEAQIPLPRAAKWERLVGAEVDRLQAGA
jgi:pimeloyl-ACP methyl ester carboxylesterase